MRRILYAFACLIPLALVGCKKPKAQEERVDDLTIKVTVKNGAKSFDFDVKRIDAGGST